MNCKSSENYMKDKKVAPIGVFDSGYGGLTVYKELQAALPNYDFIYLGDNARVPYGSRSFEIVYKYTLECVKHLFDKGCPLVILACNTASAKALRSIQQLDLPKIDSSKRVLGVIRPTTETIGELSQTKHVGLFGTIGTVKSDSYRIEIQKFFPEIKLYQEACPLWVPLIEHNEHLQSGADYFIQKHVDNLLAKSDKIDTIILACTHYPLLQERIRHFLPEHIQLIAQGKIVANSLVDYLQRHPEMDGLLSKQGQQDFYTTAATADFDAKSTIFLGEKIESKNLPL